MFAKRLKEARERRDYSQSEAARRCGFVPSQWAHMESGRREPNVTNLRKIATRLDVSADFLLGLGNEARRVCDQSHEQALLLTTARVLRSRIREMAPAYQEDDIEALNEALAPFDPSKEHGGDFAADALQEG